MRQEQILDFIGHFIAARHYAPSIREIGEAMGLCSTSTVAMHLDALERKGAIQRQRGQMRTLQVLGASRVEVCPLCGHQPSPHPN